MKTEIANGLQQHICDESALLLDMAKMHAVQYAESDDPSDKAKYTCYRFAADEVQKLYAPTCNVLHALEAQISDEVKAMTNKPMLSVERELLERVVDNRYREKENISIARHEALWELRALLDEPATTPNCQQIQPDEAAMLNNGEYTPEELFGVGGKPTCPGCDECKGYCMPAAQQQGEPVACSICRDLGDWCLECEEAEFANWADRHFASADYRKTGAGVYIQDWMRHAFAAWQGRKPFVVGWDQGCSSGSYTVSEQPAPVAEVVSTGGPHDEEDRVLVELQAELPPVGTKLYAEQGAPVAVVMPERSRLRDLIAEAIGGDTYDCTRVWSAWGVGTMSDDDFVPVVEQDERLYEIADSVLAEVTRLNTPQ